jgi:hypothetical protein
MMGYPVSREVFAAAYPDTLLRHHVIEEALEARGATWVTANPEMQANRHHFRLICALSEHEIEAVSRVRKKIVGGRENRPSILGIVDAHCVRHDQMMLTVDTRPVGQLVIVAV